MRYFVRGAHDEEPHQVLPLPDRFDGWALSTEVPRTSLDRLPSPASDNWSFKIPLAFAPSMSRAWLLPREAEHAESRDVSAECKICETNLLTFTFSCLGLVAAVGLEPTT